MSLSNKDLYFISYLRSEYLSVQRIFLNSLLDNKQSYILFSSEDFLNKSFNLLYYDTRPIFKNYVDKDYVFIEYEDFYFISFLTFNVIKTPYFNVKHLLDKNVLCLKNMFMFGISKENEDYFVLSQDFTKDVVSSNLMFYDDKLSLSKNKNNKYSIEYLVKTFNDFVDRKEIDKWSVYIINKYRNNIKENMHILYASLYNFCVVIDIQQKICRYYVP
ncbi:MAG: hypothetical protein QXF12_08105 [Candidatus Aenigmatarchaeota archaeon]